MTTMAKTLSGNARSWLQQIGSPSNPAAFEVLQYLESLESEIGNGSTTPPPQRFSFTNPNATLELSREEFVTLPTSGQVLPHTIAEGDRWIRRASSGRGWELCVAKGNEVSVYNVKIVA
jgi:hypothetical protein